MYGFWFKEDTIYDVFPCQQNERCAYFTDIFLKEISVGMTEPLASVVKVTNASQATRLLAFNTLRNLLGAKIFCLTGRK